MLFVWSDNGSLDSFEFQIANDMKSAQGSGTFSVGAGCVVNHCVNMHIYGWDDDDNPGSGYGNPTSTFSGVTSVPEPTAGAMLLAGLGALGWARWAGRAGLGALGWLARRRRA